MKYYNLEDNFNILEIILIWYLFSRKISVLKTAA